MIRLHFTNETASRLPSAAVIELSESGIPRTPAEIIQAVRRLIQPGIDTDIYSVSEFPVLTLLHAIRSESNPCKLHDVRIIWYGQYGSQVIRHDSEGELVDRVPGGLFHERAELLFD